MSQAQQATTVESLVLFRNNQGTEGRGTLVQVSRNMAVFEVYNPYSLVQLGEVVEDLQIRRGDRVIYQGRAVVSNLMSTGLMVIASVTLVDAWADQSNLTPGPDLREEAAAFVEDWETRFSLLEAPYQAAVGKLTNFCQELNRWLTHSEAAVGLNYDRRDATLQEAFVHDVSNAALPKLCQLLGEFEERASDIPPRSLPAHKEFVRQELHPLMLCSPFIHRTYSKPLGYAGDYEMVNMIFREPWEGRSAYARIINAAFIQTDTAQGHRNRVARLVRYLEEEAAQHPPTGPELRVLNVGCGPAIEIQRFIRHSPDSERCHFDLVDFDPQTLAFVRQAIDQASQQSRRRVRARTIRESIHTLLKRASRPNADHGGVILRHSGEYHLIYCAGLFDYLSDRVCRRLLKMFFKALTPGGLMVVTNVHPVNPIRRFMEHVVDWSLIHRDQRTLHRLAPAEGRAEVAADPTGTNIFLEVRRSM